MLLCVLLCNSLRQALVSSCKEFLFENETLRPVSGTALHCLLQQIKVDQVTGGEDDPLWLADLGSIRLVATLLASLLNDIVVQSMITEKAIEREGFTMRYETYEQVLEELIPGELFCLLSNFWRRTGTNCNQGMQSS